MSAEIQDTHFTQLLGRYPNASRLTLKSGASLITVPAISLPAGWSATETPVRFIISSEYPYACPDCFYGDEGLCLAGGGNPQNSAENPIPETHQKGRWFSWHVHDRWNSKRDNLLTWMACITDRLRRAR